MISSPTSVSEKEIPTRVTLGILPNASLEAACGIIDRNLSQQVLSAVAELLHREGVGNTPIQHFEIRGGNILAKLESENPTRSYKIRGAWLSLFLADLIGVRECVTASTGNHGAAVVAAASRFGIAVRVFVPETTPDFKKARLRGPQSEITIVGREFEDAKREAQAYAARSGAFFVAPYDSAAAIAGQASIGVELAELPTGTFDSVFVPIGGGGLSAGIAAALWSFGLDVPVFGVVASASPAAALSFHSPDRKIISSPTNKSIADGALVATPGIRPWEIIKRLLSGIIIVQEAQIEDAIADLAAAGIIAEGAAALPVAAVLSQKITVRKPLCVISGSNIDPATHGEIINRVAAHRRESEGISWAS